MAFIAKLGTYSGPTNKIKKDVSFTDFNILAVKNDEGVDLKNPTLTIATSQDISQYNYAYIERYHRYYYIETPRIVRTGIWELTLHSDVLMSYADGILNSQAEFERSADFCNMYLSDPSAPVTQASVCNTRVFPNSPFDNKFHDVFVTLLGTN